jgi:putative two-component system response regulator
MDPVDFPATVLVVDDESTCLEALATALRQQGFDARECPSAETAERMLQSVRPDLVLVDVETQGLSRIDLFKKVNPVSPTASKSPIPIIVLNRRDEPELRVRTFQRGAVECLRKPCYVPEVVARVRYHVGLRRQQAALLDRNQVLESQQRLTELHNRSLEQRVAQQSAEILGRDQAMLFALSKLAESRDPETGRHLERVQEYARLIAEALARIDHYRRVIDASFLSNLVAAVPLHDIGKVGIPDSILLKPEGLTPDEMRVMQSHTVIGSETLQEVDRCFPGNEFVRFAIDICRSHHERWDGTGYPDRLAGTDIPLSARITAVADVYDVMTSKRCYKTACEPGKALEILASNRGTHFDPDLVDAFLAVEAAVREVRVQLSDEPDTREACGSRQPEEAMSWKTLPGYRWVRMIARGGSGVVFEATAPGGFGKAVKIVPTDAQNPLSQREREGLKLIRSIRHPFLVGIDRVDMAKDHITIVMELVEHNLREEFRRRTAQGEPGIPRGQLLRWLEEAADVLDLLNNTYKVQHLDVKPENLFLVAGHIKLGDFGLLRNVEDGTLSQRLNAVSAAYAAPELFDGSVSKACDQYSLAVVYMEMLTSQQPYNAMELRQSAMQRLTRSPDLGALPECDRAIIARALSRNPSERFNCCQSLVAALQGSERIGGAPVRVVGAKTETGQGEPLPLLQLATSTDSDEFKICKDAVRDLGPKTASVTATCIANATPSTLLVQIPPFAKQWGAEILHFGVQRATLRFASRASWLRQLMHKKDSIVVNLQMLQREGKTTATLVQIEVAYHGGKIAEETFKQYQHNVVQLIKSFVIPREGLPTHVRQHERFPVKCPVTLLCSGPGATQRAVQCTAIDYSARGVGLVSRSAVTQGEVQVLLPGATEALHGQIVACRRQEDGNYRLGLCFAFEPQYPAEFLRSANPSL